MGYDAEMVDSENEEFMNNLINHMDTSLQLLPNNKNHEPPADTKKLKELFQNARPNEKIYPEKVTTGNVMLLIPFPGFHENHFICNIDTSYEFKFFNFHEDEMWSIKLGMLPLAKGVSANKSTKYDNLSFCYLKKLKIYILISNSSIKELHLYCIHDNLTQIFYFDHIKINKIGTSAFEIENYILETLISLPNSFE